MNKDHIKEEPC